MEGGGGGWKEEEYERVEGDEEENLKYFIVCKKNNQLIHDNIVAKRATQIKITFKLNLPTFSKWVRYIYLILCAAQP